MRKTLVIALAAAVLVVAAVGALAFAGRRPIEPSPAANGDLEGLTWSIVSAEQRRRIAIPRGGLTYKAKQGVYLIVELKLDNASGGAARAVGEYLTLLGGDGERYSPTRTGRPRTTSRSGPTGTIPRSTSRPGRSGLLLLRRAGRHRACGVHDVRRTARRSTRHAAPRGRATGRIANRVRGGAR